MTTKAYIPNSCITDNLGGSLATFYDFEVDAGVVGTIELPGDIPENAIITKAVVDVLTDPTSGGAATVAVGIGSTNDALVSATAIASVTGVVVGKTTTDAFKTSGGMPTVTIGTAALTAGKMAIYVEWIGSFNDVESVDA